MEGEEKASLVPLGKAVALALAKSESELEAEKAAAAAAEAEGLPAPETERAPWYVALDVSEEVMAERAAAERASALEAHTAPPTLALSPTLSPKP